MGSIDAYAPGPVLGTDDVGVELDFDTGVAYLGGILLQRGRAHVGQRRNHLVVERIVGEVVVVVDGTGEAASQYREVETEVELVDNLPGEVGTYEVTAGDGGHLRHAGTCGTLLPG